ncbi:hypothetical protein [Tardiphaga sp.]|uniref:hypothetical protein n=1 Tax=Tardiphaga sp. TaxID=1926292 RepID=UPI003529E6A5
MPLALKQSSAGFAPARPFSPLLHLVWFAAAGLFVSLLAMTYGLDLSAGFF